MWSHMCSTIFSNSSADIRQGRPAQTTNDIQVQEAVKRGRGEEEDTGDLVT